jgi:hypothetical protein
MKKMLAVALFLIASPVMAQDQKTAALTAAGCGPERVEFDVKADKKQHPAPQPETGKALVYVFEDLNTNYPLWGVTTKVGVDGSWTGANKSGSYFFFPVEPGDHRVCTKWQSDEEELASKASAASFSAEAGKIYYFRACVRLLFLQLIQVAELRLEPVDPAEAEILIADSALSSSHPKKQN